MINLFTSLKGRSLLFVFVALADLILAYHVSAAWIVPLMAFMVLPGRLLLCVIVPNRLSLLTTALYSVGLGLLSLIVIGFGLNLVTIFATNHEVLSTFRILFAVHLELGVLSVLALWRHRLQPKQLVKRSSSMPLRPLDGVTILLSLVTLLCAIGGVNLLNNGGSNGLLMVTLGMCALLPMYVVLARQRLSSWSYIITLFAMSLTLLFVTSLRSHYLVGSDVLNEYHVYQVVAAQKFWSINQLATTYNACISITILPQILHVITGQDGLQLFRVIFQVIFSAAPLLLFAVARLYLKPLASFLASITFIAFINYNGSLPNHIRQEVALLFFMFMIMVILSRELSRNVQKLLIVLFGFAMVVSHYSTAYVAILLFLSSGLVNLAVDLIHKYRKNELRIKPAAQELSVMTLRITAIILLFSVFWYSQITQSSGGPVVYVTSIARQLLTGSVDSQHADQTSLKDQFNIFHKSTQPQNLFSSYVKSNSVAADNYQPILLSQPQTVAHLKPSFLNPLVRLLAELAKKFYKFIVIGGMLWIIWHASRARRPFGFPFVDLLIGSLAVIVLSFVIPSFTVDYDQERMFQQLLAILAIPFIYFLEALLKKLKPLLRSSLIAAYLGFYILISTSFIAQVAGGAPVSLQLNNSGTDYNRYYVHGSELAAAMWMKSVHRYQPIYTDGYAENRLNFINSGLFTSGGLTPGKFYNGAYIYYDTANVQQGVTDVSYENGLLAINAPTTYLQGNTSQIYSNGGGAVYAKR